MSQSDSTVNVIACTAAFGAGGMGRHFSEIAQDRIAAGERVICFSPRPPDGGQTIPSKLSATLLTYTPLRYSPGWMQCVSTGSLTVVKGIPLLIEAIAG